MRGEFRKAKESMRSASVERDGRTHRTERWPLAERQAEPVLARTAVDEHAATSRGLDEQGRARLAADEECRVLILTGAGPAFCAGADLKQALAGQPAPGADPAAWCGAAQRRPRPDGDD